MSACGYCAVYAGRGVSPCPLCGGTEGLRLVPRDAPAWPAIRSGASLGAAGPLPVTGSDKGPAPITPGPQYPVGATAAEAHQALLQAGAKNGGCLPAADMVERIERLTGGAVTAADMHAVRLAWLKANRPEKFAEMREAAE